VEYFVRLGEFPGQFGARWRKIRGVR
jgi:hypothetical protein